MIQDELRLNVKLTTRYFTHRPNGLTHFVYQNNNDTLTFEFVDKILQCDHLNESSVNGLKYDRPSECSPEKDCLG